MEAAPPWGPGPPASAAPREEPSGVLGPGPCVPRPGPYLTLTLIPVPIRGIRADAAAFNRPAPLSRLPLS